VLKSGLRVTVDQRWWRQECPRHRRADVPDPAAL